MPNFFIVVVVKNENFFLCLLLFILCRSIWFVFVFDTICFWNKMCVAHYQFSSMSRTLILFNWLYVLFFFVSLCVLSFDLDRFSCCWFRLFLGWGLGFNGRAFNKSIHEWGASALTRNCILYFHIVIGYISWWYVCVSSIPICQSLHIAYHFNYVKNRKIFFGLFLDSRNL